MDYKLNNDSLSRLQVLGEILVLAGFFVCVTADSGLPRRYEE